MPPDADLDMDEATPMIEMIGANADVIEKAESRQRFREAMERMGDSEAACKEYGVVLERWGQAKPHSITATAARKRSDVLGCK